jgi:CBS domain-containing protein
MESLWRVVEEMLRKNVSSVLITEEGKPVGIITDREILREMIERRREPRETLAGDLNYTPLVTLSSRESMTDAFKKMQKESATRVAVLKDGQFVGMLTRGMALPEGSVPEETRASKK